MDTKKIIKWSIAGVILLFLLIFAINSISTSNQEVRTKNAFTQKLSERVSFYDKMYKVISQKSQIAVKNDSSFRQNINIIMAARKDNSSGLLMKWVQEVNPNANYDQVALLYSDLSRTIESEREGFFQQEKYLQDIKMQHDNLLHQFPANILFSILGTKDIQYTPITSDQTDAAFKSGKDNDTKLNL